MNQVLRATVGAAALSALLLSVGTAGATYGHQSKQHFNTPVKPPVFKPPVVKPPVFKPPIFKPPVYHPPKPPVYHPPKPPVYHPPKPPHNAVPELALGGAGNAAVLVLGGLVLVAGTRRRRIAGAS